MIPENSRTFYFRTSQKRNKFSTNLRLRVEKRKDGKLTNKQLSGDAEDTDAMDGMG